MADLAILRRVGDAELMKVTRTDDAVALATQLTHIGLVLAPEDAALITGHMTGEVDLVSPVLPATWTPKSNKVEKDNKGNHLTTFSLVVGSQHQSASV